MGRLAKNNTNSFEDSARPPWPPCPGFTATLLLARPAGYHSGHVSACSSNEECLAVNEINTDIRLAQQELSGTERARGRREVG